MQTISQIFQMIGSFWAGQPPANPNAQSMTPVHVRNTLEQCNVACSTRLMSEYAEEQQKLEPLKPLGQILEEMGHPAEHSRCGARLTSIHETHMQNPPVPGPVLPNTRIMQLKEKIQLAQCVQITAEQDGRVPTNLLQSLIREMRSEIHKYNNHNRANDVPLYKWDDVNGLMQKTEDHGYEPFDSDSSRHDYSRYYSDEL